MFMLLLFWLEFVCLWWLRASSMEVASEVLQFENQFLCNFTLGVIDVVVLLILTTVFNSW